MGCDKRGDGDGDNNNKQRMMNHRSEVEVDEEEVPYMGIPGTVVFNFNNVPRIRLTREQAKANRRMLKKLGLLEIFPRMTEDSPKSGYAMVRTSGGGHTMRPFINRRAILAAEKRREAAGSKPVVVNQVMNLEAGSSRATAIGTKAKGIQGSLLKHPREDLDESPESLLNNPIPAADSFLEIAKAKGGSVLKRHRVDLGESSDILAENLNSASDPSPTAGTKAEEKGGCVPNKDLGESSEIVVENLNPGADSSATNVASVGTQAEVKGGSVLKRPAADPSATVGTKDEVEGGSVLKRACVNLGESSELVAGNLNPADRSAATGAVANVKGGFALNKDLGESSEVVVKNLNPGADS